MAFLPLGRAGIDHTVIIIRHADDPRAQRDVYALQPFGIPRAVPLFVVAANQVDDAGEVGLSSDGQPAIQWRLYWAISRVLR